MIPVAGKIHPTLNRTIFFKMTEQHIQKDLNQGNFPQEKLKPFILFRASQMSLPWVVPTFTFTQVIHLRGGSDLWVPESLLWRKAIIWGGKSMDGPLTITGRMSFVSQRKKCRYVQSAVGALRGKPDQVDLVRDTVKIGTSILLDVLVHWLIGSDLWSLALWLCRSSHLEAWVLCLNMQLAVANGMWAEWPGPVPA